MEFYPIETQINYSFLKKLKFTFKKDTIKKSIFHYTFIYGLQGILSKKILYFTNINYMNDKNKIIANPESLGKDIVVSEKEQSNLSTAILNSQENIFIRYFSLDSYSPQCRMTIQKKSIIKVLTYYFIIKISQTIFVLH